jgi:hypothetical protein
MTGSLDRRAATRCCPPPGEPYALLAQTHTSMVIFAGGLAYKVKKPVRLPFLDLSTRASRLANCRLEVALNRRLSPDVYLGVGHLVLPRGGDGGGDDGVDGGVDGLVGVGVGVDGYGGVDGLVGVGVDGYGDGEGEGGPEPVVVMRRMPRERRMSAVLSRGEDLRPSLRAVAEQVARLHDAQPPVHDYGLAATMTELWREGREQLIDFEDVVLPRAALDEIAALAAEYVAGRTALLDERERTGQVRDGHGDLLADDIFCLDDGPRILDCLEFDSRLRLGDVLADVAFLAMDLDLHGAPDLADWFLDRYREAGGRTGPRSLQQHYIGYRAFVRAKIECLRHDQGDAEAAGRAHRLADLSLRRLREGRVHLVLVGGLPGAGKSTLAQAVAGDPADPREWQVLSSDVVRKRMAGVGPTTDCAAPVGLGLYDAAHTEATYRRLLATAGEALAAGLNVVLDASWTDERHRTAARRLAATCSAALTEIRCVAPPQECARRLTTRGRTASDADVAVLAAMADRVAPWPQAWPVSTSGGAPAAVDAVRRILARNVPPSAAAAPNPSEEIG